MKTRREKEKKSSIQFIYNDMRKCAIRGTSLCAEIPHCNAFRTFELKEIPLKPSNVSV